MQALKAELEPGVGAAFIALQLTVNQYVNTL